MDEFGWDPPTKDVERRQVKAWEKELNGPQTKLRSAIEIGCAVLVLLFLVAMCLLMVLGILYIGRNIV